MSIATSRRAPTLGETVLHDSFEATITRVHTPGHPKSLLDLTYYIGDTPRFASRVPHGIEASSWCWPEEKARPKTLQEILGELEASGVRVPKLDAWVAYAYQKSQVPGMVEVIPTRARIVGIASPTRVDLDVHRVSPPDDPGAPDHPLRTVMGVERASEGSRASKLGHEGCWAWPEDEEIVRFGPIRREEVYPPCLCGRCGRGCRRLIEVTVGERPAASICERCSGELRDFLAEVEPAAADVP